MANYRTINIGYLLYEWLRAPLSVNAAGNLSYIYKFCISCLYPIQKTFNTFSTWRDVKYIIASCKWQIGQLTNVLNYLYDSVSQRIYITQVRSVQLLCPTIYYESTIFAPAIDAAELTSSDSLGVAGIPYMVSTGICTYNGVDYNADEIFTTVTGVTSFTGTGTAVFATFAPKIDDTQTVLAKVMFHVPPAIIADPLQLAAFIDTIQQIKITGLFPDDYTEAATQIISI